MSRIGKKPVAIPSGVTVDIKGRACQVSGPRGCLSWELPVGVSVTMEADTKQLRVDRADDVKQTRALHGMSRSLLANMVQGVAEGFQRRLLVYGTGYSCNVQDGKLCLNVGFMGRGTKTKPQFQVPIPEGVEVTVETPAARGDLEPARFVIQGCDKQSVGDFAARVRGIRPPEPYKGKGIRYEGEFVRKKQGKAFAGGGG